MAYALSWPIASAAAFDFHEVAFAPVLMAVALERLQAGRLRTALAALALLLLVKEDMGLFVAGLGCYLALDQAGLRCPADISVVGFNDMPFIDMLRPPLTTIAFPHYQVGTEAAQLLIERLNGDVSRVKVLYLAPELIVRGSTAHLS